MYVRRIHYFHVSKSNYGGSKGDDHCRSGYFDFARGYYEIARGYYDLIQRYYGLAQGNYGAA